MNKSIRAKYDPSLRVKVVAEYLQGASAKELCAKYGIKQRTIYEWSKKAKKGILVSSSDKKGIDFLKSIVEDDNKDYVYNKDNEQSLEKKIESLESKIESLEYIFKELVKVQK